MKLWLKWLYNGKPYLHYTGFNCSLCGKWWNKKFQIPEYKSDGKYWDTVGICPPGKGCW